MEAIQIWYFLFGLAGFLQDAWGMDPQYKGPRVVVRGRPFTIECRLSQFDFPKWTKDGIPLDDDGNYTLTEDGAHRFDVLMTLSVEEAKPLHGGEYRCNSFSRKSHKIALQDDGAGNLDAGKVDKTMVLKVNSSMKIPCDLPVNTAFKIYWFKDYVRLLPEKHPDLIIRGNSLIIRSAQESDAGEYMCTRTEVNALSKPAVSSALDVIGHITTVKLPVRVEAFPRELSIMQGTDLELECKVHGDPPPRIMWLIGNFPVALLEDRANRLNISKNKDNLEDAIFRLSNMSYEDRNLYTCRAENSVNVDESSVFVTLREGRVSTNANDTYGGVLLEKDKILELQCNITVQNDEEQKEFQIKWVRDGTTLNEGEEFKDFIIQNDNFTLKVDKPIEGKHTGHYMCIFSRGEESYNASIFVQNKAHVTQFARSVNLVQGDTLPLKCFFGGVPTPTIRWYKDEEPLNLTDYRMNISQGEEGKPPLIKRFSLLKITDLDYDDKGTYKCEADNGLSEEPAFTTITVRVKDKLAALWPFLGICAEVAILCTIIFVYEKKRVKPDFEENEADQNTDNKNVLDQKEGAQDVRQRK